MLCSGEDIMLAMLSEFVHTGQAENFASTLTHSESTINTKI